jgi:hypothetical protein
MNASLRHAHALGTAGVVGAAPLGVVLLGLLSIAVLVSRRIWHRRFSPQWIGLLAAHSVFVVWFLIPIVALLVTMFLAAQVVQPGSTRNPSVNRPDQTRRPDRK